MFLPFAWDPQGTTDWCEYAFGLGPQFSWVFDYYGGKNPTLDFMKLSNIVFSNGTLDPWKVGGVTFDVSEKTQFILIEDSAHHLDLRLPNPADPPSLTAARKIEMEAVATWIDEYQATNFAARLAEKFQDDTISVLSI